jgi:ribose-phosphate pyrophosphokinase
MTPPPFLFAGSSHPKLAKEVCLALEIPCGKITLGHFPDGEISVEILENVHGRDVFVLQSISRDPNYYLVELLIMVDALKRSSAKSIVAIIPYLGYCRQDRKNKAGFPISAKLVANLLTSAGVTHLITFDLHADQVEGFFELPIYHLHCQHLFYDRVKEILGENCTVLAPDLGSIKIAEKIANLLDVDLAVIKKERLNSFDVTMSLIGNVTGKNVLISDDLCSTGGTLTKAANLCREQGANKIIAIITHGLFVGEALQKIESSALDLLLITTTIPLIEPFPKSTKINSLSVAPLLVEAMKNILVSTSSFRNATTKIS